MASRRLEHADVAPLQPLAKALEAYPVRALRHDASDFTVKLKGPSLRHPSGTDDLRLGCGAMRLIRAECCSAPAGLEVSGGGMGIYPSSLGYHLTNWRQTSMLLNIAGVVSLRRQINFPRRP
jgi:hypothetical protein